MLSEDHLSHLSRRMEELRVTQRELADRLGWSRTSLNKFLNGRITISSDRLLQLTNALFIDVVFSNRYPDPES